MRKGRTTRRSGCGTVCWNEPELTDDSSTLRRFIDWYARDPASPHGLSVEELLALLEHPLMGRGEVRRQVLRQTRAALLNAPGLLDDEPTRRRFNELREELAALYLHDSDLPAGERLQAALAALLEAISPFDETRRPEALHLAGEILEKRADERRDLDDRTSAASSFADAWRTSRSARRFVSARRAVGPLLLRVAGGDDDRAAAARRQLAELSEDVSREAGRVLREVAERFREFAPPDRQVTEVERLDPALRLARSHCRESRTLQERARRKPVVAERTMDRSGRRRVGRGADPHISWTSSPNAGTG